MFKKAVRDYRKDFLKVYFSDLSLVLIIASFLIYARWKISSYLSLINSYVVDFNAVQEELTNQTAGAVYKLQLVLSEVSPLVNRLNLFVFFIVPLIVFIAWCIFMSINYSVLRNEKLIRILPAIAVITIPFYLALLYIANYSLGIIKQSLFGDWKLYLFILLSLAIMYLMFSAYSFVTFKDVKQGLVSWMKNSVSRFPKAFPIMFLHFVSFMALFFSVLNIAIQYVTNNLGSTFWSFIVALLSIILIGLSRSWFYVVVTKQLN